jgi:outer membrane immunogenic protein
LDLLGMACAGGIGGFGTNCAAQSLGDTKFRFNPYAGVNWQFAPNWVAGIDGDFGFAKTSSTLAGIAYPGGGALAIGSAGDSFNVKTGWDAGLRARLGFLITPTFLIYGTGGAAWQQITATVTCNDALLCNGTTGVSPFTAAHSVTALGYSVGGGIEAMVANHWLLRAEYRYADFGTLQNSDAPCGVPCTPANTLLTTYQLRLTTQTATFGLAYKF